MDRAAPGVRMLSVSHIVPEPAPAPAENTKVKLSLLDAPWVATPPVQEVYLYKAGVDQLGAVIKRLKESLASTLAIYLPLAGKLDFIEDTQDLVVDCSHPEVAFFEAEAIADGMDQVHHRLGLSMMEIASLVPEHDARVLPAPVFTVQATRLNAGLAIGTSVHHAVVDGRALYVFLQAWSSIARGESPVAVIRSLGSPHYIREAIANGLPRGDEHARDVINKVAPNLPLANVMDGYFSQHSKMGRQTFILGATDIRTLKERIDGLAATSTSTEVAKPVSAFVALSALSWTAFVQAKGLTAGQDTHLVFQVDLRARLHPPVGASYLGNCIRSCVVSVDAGDLIGDGDVGLLCASRAIQAAVREVATAPLAGMETWIKRVMSLPVARQVCVAGSPLFRVHKLADFGYGMPDNVVPVFIPGSPDTPGRVDSYVPMNGRGGGSSRVVLSGGKRDGDVHLSVSLDLELMDAFKNHINSTQIRSKF